MGTSARSDSPPPGSSRDPSATGGSAPGGGQQQARDVVVVGGGVAGLTVACLLAEMGRNVVLLEASAELGGACRGVTVDGHRYDPGVLPITGAGPGGALSALCDRLKIALPTTACDPALQIALVRHRVDLTRTADGWWPEIHREFPDDEEGWHELVTDLASLADDRDALARRLPPLPPVGWADRFHCWRRLTIQRVTGVARPATRTLQRAAETPFHRTLAEYGLSAPSRQTLEACLWYLLLRGAEECSTLEAAVALQRLRQGVAVTGNGTEALVGLLAQHLRDRGGEVRLRTGAVQCVAERGRVAGVTTTAGETIRARWVVADVPPGVLMGDLWPASRGFHGRRQPVPGPWEPQSVAQVLGMAVPEAFIPSELAWHCLIVEDAGRAARDENVVFVHRVAGEPAVGGDEGLVHLSVGRFVSAAAPSEEETVARALLASVDRVIPGVAEVAVQGGVIPAPALAAAWGRPSPVVRYTVDSRAWLGRRGLPHRTCWPGLLAVGEWTYPGRLLSDIVEGAMSAVDYIALDTP